MAMRCMALRRSIGVTSAAAVLSLLTFVAPTPAQAQHVVAVGPTSGTRDTAVLDVVMLVDESGSETNANVADEKQAAGTIVQTMLNPRSRVTVVGFGGVNHVAPNQDPVNVVCQPTIASGTTNLGYLASCVNKLHRRSEAEGDDTDYAAALGQAMSYFNPDTTFGQQSPSGAIKVILMMTDGGVDVHRDTQQYGTNWLLGEQQAVRQQLAVARQDGAQVWPLGFGIDLTLADQFYLNYLAANGAQTACDNRQVSKPHAAFVPDPASGPAALNALYAEAGCLGTSVAPSVTIGGGQTGTLQVTIPAIASDAAISVARGNPGVQVSYYLPDGKQWTDSSAISGQGSPVEVLHVADITSAEAGTWQIHLTATPGLASQLVSATAFWQGAVRAVITADPLSAKLGQQIGVTLSVLGPNGPITDPSTLAQLQVAASVSGDGLNGPTPVRITNAGEATGVGDFKGTFTAPQATGTLTFTGTSAGYGLYATEVPATVQVGAAVAGFTATVQLPVVNSVQTGQGITGQLSFVNQTSAARTVRLELSVSPALATITSPAGPVTVKSGNLPGVPFTITFDKDSPVGPAWLEVKAVDAANPSLVYSDVTMNVTVTKPPGFLARYLWVIVGIIALIVLAILALLWMRAAHRRKVDVRGLIAILRHDGEQLGAELKAPSKWSDTFRFIIRDEDQKTARLDYPQPGFSAYTVRRAANGEITLMTPTGDRYDHVVVGGPGEHLDHNGLKLDFRDVRRATVRFRSSPGGSGLSTPKPAPPGVNPRQGAAPSAPPTSSPPDQWL